MTCSYCGYTMDAATAQDACDGCPMSRGCTGLRCARCGWETPRPLETPRWMKALWGWLRPARVTPRADAVERLVELAPGERGRVTGIDTGEAGATRKLVALGLVPGARVAMERTDPLFVVRLGHSRFALDASIASAVRVERTHRAEAA